MSADLIIKNIGKLATMRGKSPFIGKAMNDIEIIENAYVAVKDGKFYEIGIGNNYNHLIDVHTIIDDAKGRLVTPGLIDAHTHLVHGGSRENEFAKKITGGIKAGFIHPRMKEHILFLEDYLAKNNYFAGDFSFVDIQMSFPLMAIQDRMGGDYPNISTYLERVKQRVAFNRVKIREQNLSKS